MQSVAVITERGFQNKKCSGTLIASDKVLTSHYCVRAHVYDCKENKNCDGMHVVYHKKVPGYRYGSDIVHEIKHTFVPESPDQGSDRGIAILVSKNEIEGVQDKLLDQLLVVKKNAIHE